MKETLFSELARAIVDMDEDAAVSVAEIIAVKIVNGQLDIASAIEIGVGGGMDKVGELYESGEYFIPDLLVCADAAQKAVDVLLKSAIREPTKKGIVVIGTAAGDTHDIGKNIVALFMKSAGYEVIDLGKDVPARRFVDSAVMHKADVIAVSTLMTTTMGNIKDIIELLAAEKKRHLFKVIIGGKPVCEEFAEEIGADGYAENAVAAVRLLNGGFPDFKFNSDRFLKPNSA
ncbi:dimethylamine corrinoid protein [Clostridia bacterium]|nr:dimethylamine corrinoid protein [Clostridia bacterium]